MGKNSIKPLCIFLVLFLFVNCSSDVRHHTGENEAIGQQPDPALCGNGILDLGEDCEPGLSLSADCTTFGVSEGVLACTDQCTFDPSDCSGEFGNVAVESVTGTLTQGGEIVIRGAGFGSKDSATPLLWDEIKNTNSYDSFNLQHGDYIPTENGDYWKNPGGQCEGCPWSDGSYSATWVGWVKKYDGEYNRFPGQVSYWAEAKDGSGRSGGFSKDLGTDDFPLNEYFYFSVWRFDDLDFSDSSHKNFRLYGHDKNDTPFKMVTDLGVNPRTLLRTGAQTQGDTYYHGSVKQKIGDWYHYEALIKASDVPANSNAWVSIDGKAAFEEGEPETIGLDFSGGNIKNFWTFGIECHEPSKVDPEITHLWSEVYIDTTAARIILSTSSDHDLDKREEQPFELLIPKQWSDGSITAELRLGDTFNSGDWAYLYVYDRHNVRSNPHPIRIP